MQLYLAERDPQHHAWAKHGVEKESMQLRILLSYWYYKDVDLDALFAKYFTEPYPDVFADSGGFSAFTQGAQIDWREYVNWLKRFEHLFSAYANLDVIGNSAKTEENQKRLEDSGLMPLPVFHVGSDWSILEKLIIHYRYIALGGMVPWTKQIDKLMAWLVKAFKIAHGQSVYHGFGATSWRVISSLPWYSVDSSSWGSGFRYGQVPLFDSRLGRFREAKLGDSKSCRENANLIADLGFNWLDFADRKRNDRAKICAISALSYMRAEQWLRKRHGEIKIPQRDDASAVLRLHLADTSNGVNWRDADKGIKVHLASGAESQSSNSGDSAIANGLKIYGGAGAPSIERATNGMSIPTLALGLKIHPAEHSLDRGGVGNTSRAVEWLKRLQS